MARSANFTRSDEGYIGRQPRAVDLESFSFSFGSASVSWKSLVGMALCAMDRLRVVSRRELARLSSRGAVKATFGVRSDPEGAPTPLWNFRAQPFPSRPSQRKSLRDESKAPSSRSTPKVIGGLAARLASIRVMPAGSTTAGNFHRLPNGLAGRGRSAFAFRSTVHPNLCSKEFRLVAPNHANIDRVKVADSSVGGCSALHGGQWQAELADDRLRDGQISVEARIHQKQVIQTSEEIKGGDKGVRNRFH